MPKSFSIKNQKILILSPFSPITTDCTKSKKDLTSLKSQVFLLVVDYSVFYKLQVHVIV